MKELIDLPILVLKIIFKELSINDLLTCRLVNKLFKHFSDHTNGVNKLIIGQPEANNHDHYWIYNNKSIEDKDVVNLKCFRSIKLLSIFNLDKYLKHLKIYDHQFELQDASNLINLESLEFNQNCNYNNQIINLKNLKFFVSDNNFFAKFINTPKLTKIKLNKMSQIKFDSNLESIKHLIIWNYDNKVEILKNLEIIELRYTNLPINENVLIIFKNLKQLKINLYIRDELYPDEEIKNWLIKILNDKIKLKRSIDIYLEGIKIENIDKFNELVSIEDPYWKFRLNNYDLLDLNLPFIKILYYEELEEHVNNIKIDLPSSFFDKFFQITQVHVDSVKDIDGLNWFLNKLKYLIELRINVPLDEVFYNSLPNTIRELVIYDKQDINLEFISKLSNLIDFKVTVDKDLFNLAYRSFLKLKHLKYFTFYYKIQYTQIKKIDKHFYINEENKGLDYNQLVEECNKIRSN